MSPPFTRPKFDLALDTAAHQLPFTSEQRELLWTVLRNAMHGKLRLDPTRRPGWTPEAVALREPLRREIEACRKRHDEGTILNRFEGIGVFVPMPGNKPPRQVDVVQAFAAYRASILAIQQRMDTVLRDGGHWRAPMPTFDAASNHRAPSAPPPQPIDVLVANERALGNHAGTLNWVQWEIPKHYALFSKVFELANTMHARGRLWAPYAIPDGTMTERGRADNDRRTRIWNGEFHDAILVPRDAARDQMTAQPDTTVARCSAHIIAFYESLRSPKVRDAIDEAIQKQVRAHRLPTNPRFRPPNSIWHALDNATRIDLAVQYDLMLRACYELAMAEGEPLLASEVNPLSAANPFALTKEEHAKLSAA
jgi:hypothetical protein